jgi:alginate O-acetyltransferase complex protein AlgI
LVFNSNIFLLAFLPIVFSLFWLARTKQQRYVLLTVSGYIFYGYWDWRFCFLLLLSSMISFVVGLRLVKSKTQRGRRAWLLTSVGADLAILMYFKYYNFFARSLHAAVPGISMPILDVVLPIGISFYTFHTISYIVDVYRGKVLPTRNLFEYLTYVSLFSQLVAGPIVRFRQIESDLEAIDGPPKEDWMARGVGFFVVGMVKKVVIADSIATFVTTLLGSFPALSTLGAWGAALGYTFQLYFDFSGYSDMAIGLGYLFGLRIPQNFNSPYQATGISDFWKRWHISLSTWLRDYLYIPLGGSWGTPARTSINLFITMLLGGLWHGANWTFIVWGAYHGALLCLDHAVGNRVELMPKAIRRAVTFLLVVVGWVFFRSENLGMAREWLRKLFGFGKVGGVDSPIALLVWLIGCLLFVNLFQDTWHWKFRTTPRQTWALAGLFLLAYVIMNGGESVFLYYQF